jgi:isoprenylcysteine carboxyl methyltransferase (ICMT) family protein YpbQ
MGRKITILLILALAFNLLAMIIVWLHHEFVAGFNPVVSTSFIVLRLLLDLAIIFFGGRWLIRFLLKYFPL